MRKGMLTGAVAGFLAGLLIQARGSLITGLASGTFTGESAHLVLVTIGLTLFIASLCGIICAFIGAVIEELL